MIQIDFVSGSHGNFLQKVLNNLVNNTDILPFAPDGSSHRHISFLNNMFECDHYSVLNEQHKLSNVIKINYQPHNLLKLSCLCFKRAGYNIDIDELEYDTVSKLIDTHYKDMLRLIYDRYSYQLVDYATTPSVPRYILREFFKFGFLNTSTHGLMLTLSELQYKNIPVINFEFDWFYDLTRFTTGIKKIFNFFNIEVEYSDETIEYFFSNFIKNNQYINVDDEVQLVLTNILTHTFQLIPKLNLMQEAWLNAQLEKNFNVEMPFLQEQYFSSTQEILEYINQAKS